MGDRVVCKANRYVKEVAYGKVIAFNLHDGESIGVEFDNDVKGHSLDGKGKYGHCFWLDSSYVTFVGAPKAVVWDVNAWKGYEYYRKPQLSYRYVQQMANAMAAQHNIKVEIANQWRVDTDTRTLSYNPVSLMYGTKGELLACLMRAIGKLRFTDARKDMKSAFITKYGDAAYVSLLDFEEFRTNALMMREYPSAEEIYQSQIPVIEEEVMKLLDISKAYNALVGAMLKQESSTVDALLSMTIGKTTQSGGLTPENIQKIKELTAPQAGLPATDPSHTLNPMVKDIRDKLNTISGRFEHSEIGNIYDYMAGLRVKAYGIDLPSLGKYSIPQDVEEMLEKTVPFTEFAETCPSSAAIVNMMDTQVFPVIEELLKSNKEGAQAIKDAFGEAFAQDMARQANNNSGGDTAMKYAAQGQGSGPTDDHTPPEWLTGDYLSLHESVQSEIRSLTKKLLRIRREEQVVKMIRRQRRGKLDAKSLHKFRMGNMRLFKRKLESQDTVRSFAFSIVVDISSSMDGPRIAHTTRGLIILSEVFHKLGVPFEIIAFNNSAKFVKEFSEEYDKGIKGKVGGLVQATDGGTNIDTALETTTIEKREEKNRILVVLSDGGVGSTDELDQKYFSKLNKAGVKTIPIGIECGDEIERMCYGTGKSIDIASKLPDTFYDMLKDLIDHARKPK